MASTSNQVRFACAPVSWGVQDNPGPAWEQPYEQILDEILAAGYSGTELGPYGYFPTDPRILGESLNRRRMSLLSSFVPVPITDPMAKQKVIEQVRRVGALLSALGAKFLVLSDSQTPRRQRLAGRVPANGSESLNSEQWKYVGTVIGEIERAAAEFGLDLVFHPHVATYVEAPQEVEHFFDAVKSVKIGLCLDTGHCVYGGGDPVGEARKYGSLLRYVHIKDINARVLDESRRSHLDFEQAVGAGIFSAIGDGCIDFEAFLQLLTEKQYAGWMVVEQDVIYGKTEVPPVESMRASLNFLRGVMSGLDSAARGSVSKS
jgi:inosose dehydratase